MTRTAAWRPLLLVSGAVGLLLLAFAGRYGYHRDELYFLVAGEHPAFGYVDQPPLVPLLAQLMHTLGGGSLVVLRAPSAIAAALVVLLTGLIAHELGATRRAQVLAAGCMGAGAVTYAVGHLMSTSTFDLLAWTLLSYLLVRAVRDDGRIWLWAGLVAGIGMQVKILMAFFLVGLAAGLLISGPRAVLRSRWLWGGVAIAVAIAAPHAIWQAVNGWPQLDLAEAIADGGSASSEPRWAYVPFQLVLVSPLLFPIWMAGLWQLFRSEALRPWRFFAVAYVVLVVVFVVTGGKPYYQAGFYPVLLAAGAAPTLAWVARRRSRLRGAVVAGALAAAVASSAFLFLPIVPTAQLQGSPIVEVNSDAGETVGWPRFADSVADVVDANTEGGVQPVVLTGNYGEAGAVLRHRPDVAEVHSGHNSFWTWGPPPADTEVVVAVGIRRTQLERWFGDVRRAGTIDNGLGLDNDEQGTPIWVCTSPLRSWPDLWPEVRHLN
ncbi:glycosyltransferase family 39 protein [Aeromicrobium sp. NPDC092404]|uniref:glycosyltransferase family 39 protein n=1 Tax=Aeromicrobium sp. NPDC092404 TaxID=3154976 RepID=UPI00342B64FB